MKGKKMDRPCRASGGGVEKGVKVSDTDAGAKWYAGADSNVKKEAEGKTGFKKGGKVPAFGRGKMAEGMDKFEAMKAKKAKKEGGSCEGSMSKSRLDRAKRASGGALSGTRSPFAVSEKTSDRPGFTGQDVTD